MLYCYLQASIDNDEKNVNMTTVESAQLLESGLYCCCKCKGMFSCQDERLKHQINCIGNPYKTTCSYFACERKVFLQLFQPEDFLLDGFEQPFTFSKDDSFINHFVKIRVPDIFDPSIFLKSTAPTNTDNTDDANFLLESNINTLEEEAEKTSCSTFLECNKQVDSSEDDQIQNIINKNIEYLKNNDLANLNTGANKVPSFQPSHSLPRLLSPIDRHMHLFGDGNKTRGVHSPFERSSSFSDLQDGQMGYNFMYSSNPSIPFSCNFSTDLFSSIPPPSQDDNQAFLSNVEESRTLRYLDLARKDPFFGPNLSLSQVNSKDPFLINASVKTAERPTPLLQKSHITRSCEDIQASPTLQLQDGNYFNFPSTLDEPTQLDYLDLATLDFITNPILVPSVPVLYKEKSAEKDDDIYRVADMACEEQISKTESGSKVWSTPPGSNSRNDNTGAVKNKKLRLKKSKSDVERRQYLSVLPSDKDLGGNLTVLKEDLQKENFDLVDDVVAKCSGNGRPQSETKDYRICRKRKLDSSKSGSSGEVKPTKTHKRSGDTRRMSKTDIVFNPCDSLANITDEPKGSMNDVLGETGCIYVKKKRSLSCDEPVVYVNETNVFGDTRSFYDNSRPSRPNRIRTKSNSYITGLNAMGNLESSPNKAQRLTSIIKLRCPNCSFSCQSVAELKAHCVVHEETNTSLGNATPVAMASTTDITNTNIHDSLGSILSITDSPIPNSEGKTSGSLLYSNPHFPGHMFSNISSERSEASMQSNAIAHTPNSISSFRVIDPLIVKTNSVSKTSEIVAPFNVDSVTSDLDTETELAVRAIANVASNDSYELLNEDDTLGRTNSIMSTSSNNLYEYNKATPHLDINPPSCEQMKDNFKETNSLIDVAERGNYVDKQVNLQPVFVQESRQFENLDLNADLGVASLSLYSLQDITGNDQSSNIDITGNKSIEPEFNAVKAQLDETFTTSADCLVMASAHTCTNKNDVRTNERNLFEDFKITEISETEHIGYAVDSNTDNFIVKGEPDNRTYFDGMSGGEFKESARLDEQVLQLKKSTEVDMNTILANVDDSTAMMICGDINKSRSTKQPVLSEIEGHISIDTETFHKEDNEMCADRNITPVSDETNDATEKIIKQCIDDITDSETFLSDQKIFVKDPLVTECDVAEDKRLVSSDITRSTQINEPDSLEKKMECDTMSFDASNEMMICKSGSESKLNEEQTKEELPQQNEEQPHQINEEPPNQIKEEPPHQINEELPQQTNALHTLNTESNTLYVHQTKFVREGPGSKPKRIVKIIKLQTDKPNTVDVVKSLNAPEKKLNMPEHNMNVPENNLNAPEKNLNVPEKNLNKPEMALKAHVKCLNVSVNSLNNTPVKCLKAPQVSLKTPEQCLNAPEMSSKTPVTSFNANVTSLKAPEKCSGIGSKSTDDVISPPKCSTSMNNYMKKQPAPSIVVDEKTSVTYYVCEEKGCSFKSIYKKNWIAHHKQIHLCEQKYLCDQCTYSSPHPSSLKHHIQLKHLHEKRFKCPNCDYLSKFRLDVVKHVRHTHMKQKQFACNQCEYRTGHSHSLKLHLMSHAGICSFKCNGCEYRAGSTDKVARHIKFKHANQIGMKCEKLDVTFKFDPKQFLRDEKVPNDDIQVVELSTEEAKILTEKQLKEKELKSKALDQFLKGKELKSKIPEKKPKPKQCQSNDGFEMLTKEVNRFIVMKRIVPSSENQ